MNKVFDEERIKAQIEAIKHVNYEYVLGIDTYDIGLFVYVLMKRNIDDLGELPEILMCKKMKDEVEFENEIASLAKIFNAKIVRT